MTVKELIKELEQLPEHCKELQIKVDDMSRDRDTYNPNYVCVSYDDCMKKCVIIGRK